MSPQRRRAPPRDLAKAEDCVRINGGLMRIGGGYDVFLRQGPGRVQGSGVRVQGWVEQAALLQLLDAHENQVWFGDHDLLQGIDEEILVGNEKIRVG
jgi:hypothetical protein